MASPAAGPMPSGYLLSVNRSPEKIHTLTCSERRALSPCTLYPVPCTLCSERRELGPSTSTLRSLYPAPCSCTTSMPMCLSPYPCTHVPHVPCTLYPVLRTLICGHGLVDMRMVHCRCALLKPRGPPSSRPSARRPFTPPSTREVCVLPMTQRGVAAGNYWPDGELGTDWRWPTQEPLGMGY